MKFYVLIANMFVALASFAELDYKDYQYNWNNFDSIGGSGEQVISKPEKPVFVKREPVFAQPAQPVFTPPAEPVFVQPTEETFAQPVFTPPAEPVFVQPTEETFVPPIFSQPTEEIFTPSQVDNTQLEVNEFNNNVIRGPKGLDALAQVGECYTTAYVEERCDQVSKQVMIRDSYSDTEVVPAVTKEVEEKVLIEPAKQVEEYIPALYETVRQKVQVKPERTLWKKGNFSSIQKSINGETYCLVTVPPVYETKEEKILKVPSRVVTRTIPPVYETFKRTVIVTPATTRVIKTYPAQYASVSGCVDNKAGHYEWRSILCEQNATVSVLTNVEKALSERGYLNRSAIDGSIDDVTVEAIRSYQRENNLTIDGLVNIETVKSLGVSY